MTAARPDDRFRKILACKMCGGVSLVSGLHLAAISVMNYSSSGWEIKGGFLPAVPKLATNPGHFRAFMVPCNPSFGTRMPVCHCLAAIFNLNFDSVSRLLISL